MKYSLDELYKKAKEHKDNHKSCGGEPYKSYEKLFEVVQNFVLGTPGVPLKILEVGTAVGFTTFILQNKSNFVDTIEFHQDHIEEAKQNILNWSEDENISTENIKKINFLLGDARDILPTITTPGKSGVYDVIFFDGYGAKLIFYKDFERLLKVGGILITTNQHLKSTELEYFKELENKNKWEFIEEFEDTKIYRKI